MAETDVNKKIRKIQNRAHFKNQNDCFIGSFISVQHFRKATINNSIFMVIGRCFFFFFGGGFGEVWLEVLALMTVNELYCG